jgi:hypothetical protein
VELLLPRQDDVVVQIVGRALTVTLAQNPISSGDRRWFDCTS